MKIFEFATYEEGIFLTLFGFLGIGRGGAVKPEDGDGPFTTLIIRIGKLNSIISLEWRNNANED